MNNVAQRILERVREKGGDIPPVRLSPIAQDFLIDPQPQFEAHLSSAFGKLRFDTSCGRFKIVMKPRDSLRRPLPNGCNKEETSLEDSLSRRRFTYAHEFAHRFFYVPVEGPLEWRRAVDVATHDLDPDVARDARRYLEGQEESFCGQIARRVLVPAEELATFVQELIKQEPEGLLRLLGTLVQQVSGSFAVPTESALLAFWDAIKDGYLAAPEQLFAVCVEAQVEQRGDARVIGSLRLGAMIKPRIPGKVSKRFFRLSDPAVLGPALRRCCVELLSAGQPIQKRPVEIPIEFWSSSRPNCFSLKGWWVPLTNSRTHSEFRRGLIWGELLKGRAAVPVIEG